MSAPGLAGVIDGAHLKLLSTGKHEVALPLPQFTGAQVPVCYTITSYGKPTAGAYRLRRRDDTNWVVVVQIDGQRDQEVELAWSAVVLIAAESLSPDETKSEPFLFETGCVQAGAKQIDDLAEQLWPASGKVTEFAKNIQQHVRDMQQQSRPKSLDALGILNSGANGICTANANLAAALLRSRGIPARTTAVVPPISARLEMHRIAEYYESGAWHAFDPSSLNAEIPVEPWHNIIMARTTIDDENAAMKPRMGAMVGCPYGQELELLDNTLTLWGQDFFWTEARPLLECKVDRPLLSAAAAAWQKFLKSGQLSPGQIQAAEAEDGEQLRAAFQLQ